MKGFRLPHKHLWPLQWVPRASNIILTIAIYLIVHFTLAWVLALAAMKRAPDISMKSATLFFGLTFASGIVFSYLILISFVSRYTFLAIIGALASGVLYCYSLIISLSIFIFSDWILMQDQLTQQYRLLQAPGSFRAAARYRYHLIREGSESQPYFLLLIITLGIFTVLLPLIISITYRLSSSYKFLKKCIQLNNAFHEKYQ